MATDSTGCMAGDPSNIQELIVRVRVICPVPDPRLIRIPCILQDPSTAAPAGGAATVSEAPFLCPETGMVSCSVIFTEEGKSKADLYGINIISQDGSQQ